MTQQEKDEKLRRIRRLKEDIESGEVSTEQLMTRILEIQSDIYLSQMKHEEDMGPIAEFFRTANSVRNGFVWLVGFLAAAGSILAIIKGFGEEIIDFIR